MDADATHRGAGRRRRSVAFVGARARSTTAVMNAYVRDILVHASPRARGGGHGAGLVFNDVRHDECRSIVALGLIKTNVCFRSANA